MTASDRSTGQGEGSGADGVAEWTVHPLAQEGRAKTGLLVAIIVGLTLGVFASFGGVGYSLVTLVVLLGALSRYWLPTHYCLDCEGIHSGHLGIRRLRRWDEFARLDVHREGIFLSPFVRPSRLDAFRGCFLRCHGNRDEVIDFARRQIASNSS